MAFPMTRETANAIRIILTLSAIYVASNFFRSAVAVIGPNMMDELGLTPEEFGLVGGSFFIAFALMQVPVGIFLDRYGPRKTIFVLMLLANIGSIGFALASTFFELISTRFIIGAGCAPVLMGSLVIISRWLSAERFAFYLSLIVAMGGVGNLLATTPTALLADMVGWRAVFWIAAIISLCSLVLGCLIIRDAPPGHTFHDRAPETFRDAFRGVVEVVSNRQFQYLFALNLVIYGAVMAILGLWGSNFLRDIYGLDLAARGNILLLMTAGVICGNFFYGYLDGIVARRKPLVMYAAGATILILFILGTVPVLPVWQVTILLFLLCFTGSYGVLIMSHGRTIFPERLLGRGVATLNTAVMLGVFLLQALGGFIVGHFVHPDGTAPIEAYRVLYFVLAGVIIAGLLFYSRTHESKAVQKKTPDPA